MNIIFLASNYIHLDDSLQVLGPAADDDAARRLWEASESLLGM